MKYIILVVFVAIILLAIIIPLENQRRLSDCRFECKNLQTRLTRCQELSDYAEALEQFLPSLAWAQVRALNEEIKQNRRWEYERHEQPLLTEKERK